MLVLKGIGLELLITPFKAALPVFFTLCAPTIKNVLQALRPQFLSGYANPIFKSLLQHAYPALVRLAPFAPVLRIHLKRIQPEPVQ